jgi:hypothetical protein
LADFFAYCLFGLALGVFGQLPGDGAPPVIETELLVELAIGGVPMHDVGDVFGAERVVVHRDDGGHERLLRGSPPAD